MILSRYVPCTEELNSPVVILNRVYLKFLNWSLVFQGGLRRDFGVSFVKKYRKPEKLASEPHPWAIIFQHFRPGNGGMQPENRNQTMLPYLGRNEKRTTYLPLSLNFLAILAFLAKQKIGPKSSCRRPRTCLSDWKTKAKHDINIAGGILLEELLERAVLPEMMSSTHIHCSALRWNKGGKAVELERVVGLFLVMHPYFNFWGMKTFYSVGSVRKVWMDLLKFRGKKAMKRNREPIKNLNGN
ncbi:hypothetical protein CEXT_656421 [Caerostris extrusa]|uniref:Uncharacterized protein n=1 Tax=Caerostris extrusa TaxID=172846 RepID=A0AAV4UGH8_CAEEX|nr:hypothetical protein CEXT_656421 [Caerostris extrusa]